MTRHDESCRSGLAALAEPEQDQVVHIDPKPVPITDGYLDTSQVVGRDLLLPAALAAVQMVVGCRVGDLVPWLGVVRIGQHHDFSVDEHVPSPVDRSSG